MNGQKVFLVSSKNDADYTVFFVNSKYDEKNAEIIKGGKLVNSKYDATILITRENFPKL